MALLEALEKSLRGFKGLADLMSLLPTPEIEDPERHLEFAEDCQKLIHRLGRSKMDAVLELYLLEQMHEQTPEGIFHEKMTLFSHNNTARIIARFAKNGWTDVYLSENPLPPYIVAYDKDDKPSSFWFKWGVGLYKEEFDVTGRNLPEHLAFKEGLTYIPPEDIDRVFAEIDARHEPPLPVPVKMLGV